LFGQVDTPVPMTLPAHVSLLSSTYPFVHRVEENGQQVGRDMLTLPAVLKANGYRTAAFIGGYVLDARFGLNQGFDVYDSPFRLRPDPGEDPPEVKRSADAVLSAAAQWIKSQSGHPFFAFIHLYDAHQPYSHGGYDDEIAYIDESIGRFQQSAQKTLDDALVILTSDHGESLGEHGEETHSYFIYQSTLRVPLVFHWPSDAPRFPDHTGATVGLLDVAPTVLEFLEIPAPSQFQGSSLLRLLRPASAGSQEPSSEPVYSESMYARDHIGCSALRSIRIGRYKYIDAPKPEFYDLETDPGEKENRYDRERSRALGLRARLLTMLQGERGSSQSAAPGPANPEVVARLRSLGYLSGGPSRTDSGADPKDRLGEYVRYGGAIRLANAGRLPEAVREFQAVLEEDGRNVSAHFYLAVCYFRMRRLDDALTALNATLAASPNYPPAEELLGTIWLLKEDYVRARRQFAHLASIAPGNFGAHFNLGILAMREGRIGEAREEMRQALAIDPHDEAARKTLQQLESGAR
jgi:tetratricopeptide (TPR) repeat protein